MRNVEALIAILIASCGTVGSYVRAQSTDHQIDENAIFKVPLGETDATKVESTIRRLGSNLWSERAAASESLKEFGAGVLPALRLTYCQTDDLEIRLRIEEIVNELYERFHVYDRFGFLGIVQAPIPITHEDVRHIPEGHLGVRINEVTVGTGAEAAGLIKGDIVFAINDEPIAASTQPLAEFGTRIRNLGPGTTITLSIVRRGRPHRITATLGRCPPALIELGRIYPVTEKLRNTQQRFPVWWAQHFGKAACHRK